MLAESEKDVELFIRLSKELGYECFKASKYIDIFEHWDVLLKKDDNRERVEIKGLKDAHLDGYTWIELVNVKTEIGWLYGEADVLALRLPDRFNIYKMSVLREIIETNVDFSAPILVSKPLNEDKSVNYDYMRFRQYDRRGDITVITSFEDINKAFVKKIKITEI